MRFFSAKDLSTSKLEGFQSLKCLRSFHDKGRKELTKKLYHLIRFLQQL